MPDVRQTETAGGGTNPNHRSVEAMVRLGVSNLKRKCLKEEKGAPRLA